jgi:hypothetical protein
MTATRAELAAVTLVAGTMCAICLAVGLLAGSAYAWSQSAERVAEARDAQAQAALMTLECQRLSTSCVCAVTGERCPK